MIKLILLASLSLSAWAADDAPKPTESPDSGAE